MSFIDYIIENTKPGPKPGLYADVSGGERHQAL